MTRLEDRQILLRDIGQARTEGARLAPACALAGIDASTLRRWQVGAGLRQVSSPGEFSPNRATEKPTFRCAVGTLGAA